MAVAPGVLETYIPGSDSCWMNGIINRGYDVNCVLKGLNNQVSFHVLKIEWALIIIPVLILLLLGGIYRLNIRQKEHTGYYLFGYDYQNVWGKKHIRTKKGRSIFEYGFVSYDEFRIFVFEECLLFMALAGGTLLYFNGVFS